MALVSGSPCRDGATRHSPTCPDTGRSGRRLSLFFVFWFFNKEFRFP